MNKTTKGAFAAAAAAALLMGGAGSLAYWNSTVTSNAGSFGTGTLSITGGDCDANWTYVTGGATVTKIVPGDQITKNCTYTIGAVGDHITATPTLPPTLTYSVSPSAPSLSLNAAATYKINGTAVGASPVITAANNAQTLTATVTVTMPFGNAPTSTTPINGNDTKGITATLNALTATLTQSSTSANNNA